MKNIFMDEINLYSPEYYHEVQGFDSRIAIAQLNDLSSTLGDIAISLNYTEDDVLKKIDNELKKNIIKRFHLRHAVIDSNNSFDLLLQVPWFFYRMWNEFNINGNLYDAVKYYNKKDGNQCNIIRNSNDWVELARDNCSYKKVLKYLNKSPNIKLKTIAKKLKKFNNEFIFNESKTFTIRSLSNDIKHKKSLKIKELYNRDYDINFGDKKIPLKYLKDDNIGIKTFLEFYDTNNKEKKIIGRHNIEYIDDLYINIKYDIDGCEEFRSEDYINKTNYLSINELKKEVNDYCNEFCTLIKLIYNEIELNLKPSLVLERNPVETNSINLDKYFIPQ